VGIAQQMNARTFEIETLKNPIIMKNLNVLLAKFQSGVVLIMLAFSPMLTLGQSNLTLEEGEEIVFNDEIVNLVYNELILKDNSTIILGANVKSINITGLHVSIGKDVKLMQRSPEVVNGTGGTTGALGTNGSAGHSGANVTFQFYIETMGNMDIDVRGTNGGNGGNGGHGYTGANASCNTKGTRGGNGGKAGNGGQAGNGGSVMVKFKFLHPEKEQSIIGTDEGINILNSGGESGAPGAPGNGGAGGKGHKKCGAWPVYWNVGGGSNGSRGAVGTAPEDGNKGKVNLNGLP